MTTLMTVLQSQYASMDDAALAHEARADPQAFAELYRRHVRSIYRYHLAHTGNVRDAEDLQTRAIVALPGSLPIPTGSGASIPEAANVSWSADSKFLVFDFGRGANTRAIYLAHADGTKLVKIADSAYAPTLSADGNCLAFISDKKVYLLDLRGISTGSVTAAPMVLADIPVGRGIADYRLDKLQWQP
jgi:hypothetical protein